MRKKIQTFKDLPVIPIAETSLPTICECHTQQTSPRSILLFPNVPKQEHPMRTHFLVQSLDFHCRKFPQLVF